MRREGGSQTLPYSPWPGRHCQPVRTIVSARAASARIGSAGRPQASALRSYPNGSGQCGRYLSYYGEVFMDLSVGRVLTLLELLQAYRRMSAAEIGRRLAVDGRTVRPQVTGLPAMGL